MGNRLLICDMNNLFIRSYIVDPSLSSNGMPIGGLKGVFKSLQKLCREIEPNAIVVCWDGAGGSKKRKQMNENYKAGRSPIRLNRSVDNLSESEELQNKIWQQNRLIEYLNLMPLMQFMFDMVEADDIISYIVHCGTYRDWQKVIVSSDKDFFQLLDDRTVLLRPIQNEILNKKNIVENTGIHPVNFAIARAMAGDLSDNIVGLSRVGLTTVAKRFPFLSEPKSYLIKDLVDYSKSKVEEKTKIQIYNKVVSEQDMILENYKLMQLYKPMISANVSKTIEHTIDNFEPEFNLTQFRMNALQDGFGEYDFTGLFQTMKKIVFA